MANRVPQPQGDEVLRAYNRTYSRFALEHNVYCVPVDQVEQQRLEELDGILRDLFRGRTVFTPNFPPSRPDDDDASDSPAAVLDCGFGKGAWIERLMDEYGGDLDVTGIDIFLGSGNEDDDDDDDEDGNVEGVQEFVKKRWNLNARFRDDRSTDRLRPDTFDLVNSRLLAEGINASRWPSYVRDLKHMLKEGGWLQMVELQFHCQSSAGLLRDESYLTRWWQWYASTLERMGKNPRIGRDLPRILAAEGFENVGVRSLMLPIGDWSQGQASLGRENLDNVHQMLGSLSLWPFLRIGRMSEEVYRNLIAGARAELREARYKLYYNVHVVFGRRPIRRR